MIEIAENVTVYFLVFTFVYKQTIGAGAITW
jgi:hypothetical protein